ncbi:MAG: TIM barrel protein [Leptolinea sp.]|jgi:deoxyribonuclease-4|nr:TIM barrel protein [Leptolinea sp.]
MAQSFRIGTVGSPKSTPKKPGGSIGAVQQIRALGLSALELGWVQSVRVSEETCLAIRKEAEIQDVGISVHAPYFINLNADDEEWPKSRTRLMDAAIYGNLAGATDIIFHPGSYFEKAPDEVLNIAIPRLSGCIEELRKAGNPVILRPETMGKSAMLGSLEDTLEMSRSIPGVLPCLDFAHLHARAAGKENSKSEWFIQLEKIEKIIGKSALQSLHIHLSGIEYTAKGERNHLPLKESDFNLRELLETLSAAGCSGRILCESPILEEDALYIQEVLHQVQT